MASSGEGQYSDIAMRIARMPESGADPDNIARLIDANRDPELFWWICDRGTMTPRIPALQAMMEMLFHPDIDLHPHAVGETLDQLAYHAPVSVVEAYLSRMEMLIADAPDRAANCWTDLTQPLTERMTKAGRADFASRIAAIDEAVEENLGDQDRRALNAAFETFDTVAAGDWQSGDIDAAIATFDDCDAWRELFPDMLAALETRRHDTFWSTLLMRSISKRPHQFHRLADEAIGGLIVNALEENDERPVTAAAKAGLVAIADRDLPLSCAALEEAARSAGARFGVDFESHGIPWNAPEIRFALYGLVDRAPYYAVSREDRFAVAAGFWSSGPFGAPDAPVSDRPTLADADRLIALLGSRDAEPVVPTGAATWWNDLVWRHNFLLRLSDALDRREIAPTEAAGRCILHAMWANSDAGVTTSANAAAAFLRHGGDPAWRNRLFWAALEASERHAAPSDRLDDALNDVMRLGQDPTE